MIGLLRNFVSTAALVPCTAVISTFHSSIHSALTTMALRSTQPARWFAKSLTGFLKPAAAGFPMKFVANPNGLRLETRWSSVCSFFALTFSKIDTASLRRTRMSYASR